MQHYFDIRLRSDPEFPAHQLLVALYAKLHRALVQLNSDTIGVCFPGYDESAQSLGNCLRLIGPAADLDRLLARDWLTGMHDHVSLDQLAQVPADAVHRTLRRVQAKSSPERLRRRQMKRHGLTEAQARERVPNHAAERLPWPFVSLASASTSQRFRLYLHMGPVQPDAVPGSFNAYGLSTQATIPCF